MGTGAKNLEVWSARTKAHDAANDYWKNAQNINDELGKTLDKLGSDYGQSITEYKTKTGELLSNYEKEANKYGGENAYRETTQLGTQGALRNAKLAQAQVNNAMATSGLTPTQQAMMSQSGVANNFAQGLESERQAAAKQYENALNAAGQKMAAGLNTAGTELGAAGNKYATGAQNAANLANAQLGANAQNVANWQNQMTTVNSTRGLLDRLFGTFWG